MIDRIERVLIGDWLMLPFNVSTVIVITVFVLWISANGYADTQVRSQSQSPYLNLVASHFNKTNSWDYLSPSKTNNQSVYILNLRSSTRRGYEEWTQTEVEQEIEKTIKTFAQCQMNVSFHVLDLDLEEFQYNKMYGERYVDGFTALNFASYSTHDLRKGPILLLVNRFIPEEDVYSDSWMTANGLSGFSVNRDVVAKNPSVYSKLVDSGVVYKISIKQNKSLEYSTIAHELGHIFTNLDHYTFDPDDKSSGNLMATGWASKRRGFSNSLTKEQCKVIGSYNYN